MVAPLVAAIGGGIEGEDHGAVFPFVGLIGGAVVGFVHQDLGVGEDRGGERSVGFETFYEGDGAGSAFFFYLGDAHGGEIPNLPVEFVVVVFGTGWFAGPFEEIDQIGGLPVVVALFVREEGGMGIGIGADGLVERIAVGGNGHKLRARNGCEDDVFRLVVVVP